MKNILITGASRGMGYALARELCGRGHRVLVLARSEQRLERLKRSCQNQKGEIHTFVFDLVTGDFENKLPSFVQNTTGKLDVLVNNAGLLIVKNFEDFTDTDFDLLFNVNVKALFKTVRSLLPVMNRGSHIVNISSMGGIQGSEKFPGLSLYSAAKGAVTTLTESLAVELQKMNISVNALAPGAVQTEMLAQAFPGYKAPLTAEDMAEFTAYFVLEGHRYFNGKVLPVSLSSP